jgi:putative addiction module component (TIGR02574 family)
MKPDAERLLVEALKLPEEARAQIVGRLLRSLDADEGLSEEEYDAAWGDEIAHRLEQVDRGEVEAVPWDEARRAIASDDDVPPR